MEVEYRAYVREDLSAMHALDVVCFEKPFRFTRAAMRQFAEAANASVMIAEDRGSIAGFVIVHVEATDGARVGYVVTLDVAPEHRRSGIASVLMCEAERQACRRRCTIMALHVYTENEAALSFYARKGFVRSHREDGFYGSGLDAWFLYKQIDETPA